MYINKQEILKAFSNWLIAGMLIAIGLLLLFVDLAEDMINQELGMFDHTVTSFIMAVKSPQMTEIMKLITAMGSSLILIGIALLAGWYLIKIKKQSWDATMLITALAGSSIMDTILKLAFHRNRPDLMDLVQVSGFSFPSGHAMNSFVFYGMLTYLVWINFKPGKAIYLTSFIFILLILLIGISRVYLGVHYPSDIVAGYAAGGIWLTGCILGLHKIRHHNCIKLEL